MNRFAMNSRNRSLSLGSVLALVLIGCASGDDKRCSNKSECAPSEQCEAGFCQPACAEGVDCPDGDVMSGDSSDAEDARGDDASSDATGEDGGDLGGGDTSGPTDELSCQPGGSLAAFDGGRVFEVVIKSQTTGKLTLPDGWKVAPTCCGQGCCQ
jgi:hypothetical protein